MGKKRRRTRSKSNRNSKQQQNTQEPEHLLARRAKIKSIVGLVTKIHRESRDGASIEISDGIDSNGDILYRWAKFKIYHTYFTLYDQPVRIVEEREKGTGCPPVYQDLSENDVIVVVGKRLTSGLIETGFYKNITTGCSTVPTSDFPAYALKLIVGIAMACIAIMLALGKYLSWAYSKVPNSHYNLEGVWRGVWGIAIAISLVIVCICADWLVRRRNWLIVERLENKWRQSHPEEEM